MHEHGYDPATFAPRKRERRSEELEHGSEGDEGPRDTGEPADRDTDRNPNRSNEVDS